jgi:sec-independent protein translocase protein TatB
MLDFGFSEVVVTSLIALVVLGPKRLPSVMRQVGSWVGRARVMARQLSEQLDREINAEELLQLQAKKTPTPAPGATLSVPIAPAVPPTPTVPATPTAESQPPEPAPGIKPSNE